MRKKLTADGYKTDKGTNDYLKQYEEYFYGLVEHEIKLLELGVREGGSLLMWRDYFDKGTIVGLDIDHVQLEGPTDRIHIYQGLQQDTKILDKIRSETAKEGFDIIIDDASHIGELTRMSFWHLFDNHLKPGGIYIIEDWRTGYWNSWPDGKKYIFPSNKKKILKKTVDSIINNTISKVHNKTKIEILLNRILKRFRGVISKHRFKSHDYGMVGFLKQLIDELGMDMITSPERGSKIPARDSKFLKMEIFPGQIFIIKNPKI